MTVAASVAPGSPSPGTCGPQDFCYLVGPGRFKPTGFAAPKGTLNLLLSAIPITTNASVPQAPYFVIIRALGVFPPHRAQRPNTYHPVFPQESPHCLSKGRNPTSPLSGNLPLCGCQETFFPKAQKVTVLSTMPNHRRAPSSPL
jgi:hypothetical protein